MAIMLPSLIESKLPDDAAQQWSCGGQGKESDINFYLDFLNEEIKNKEINTRERSEGYRKHVTQKSEVIYYQSNKKFQAGAATVLQTTQERTLCGLGKSSYATEICLLKGQLEFHHLHVQEAGLCFKCPLGQHTVAKCLRCTLWCACCYGKNHEFFI